MERNNQTKCPYNYEEFILDFYKGFYEAVYVIFNPFMRVSESKKYLFNNDCLELLPSSSEIVKISKVLTYDEVIKFSRFESSEEIDWALKSSIGALKTKYKNEDLLSELSNLYEKYNIIEPNEGIICSSVQEKVIKSLAWFGYTNFHIYNEFDEDYKKINISNIKNYELIGYAGSLVDAKREILLTIHWDSHFSLLCSSKQMVDKIVEHSNLDGFYCNNSTRLGWSLENVVNQPYLKNS